MAQQVNVVLIDDIDGTEAVRSLTFAVEGATYEMDLSQKNFDKFVKAMAPYTDAGRRIGAPKARRAVGAASKKRDLDAIRTWARENGHQVAERGRVKAEIIEAYEAAH